MSSEYVYSHETLWDHTFVTIFQIHGLLNLQVLRNLFYCFYFKTSNVGNAAFMVNNNPKDAPLVLASQWIQLSKSTKAGEKHPCFLGKLELNCIEETMCSHE